MLTQKNLVREAMRIKSVKIVSLDWLEDSLLSKSRRPTREGPYLFTRASKSGKKKARPGEKAAPKKTAAKDCKPPSSQNGIRFCHLVQRLIYRKCVRQTSRPPKKVIGRQYRSCSISILTKPLLSRWLPRPHGSVRRQLFGAAHTSSRGFEIQRDAQP